MILKDLQLEDVGYGEADKSVVSLSKGATIIYKEHQVLTIC